MTKTKTLIAFAIFALFATFVDPTRAIPPLQERHKDGELINSNGTIYLIRDNKRWGFRTADEFLSHGYRFEMALPPYTADLELPVGSTLKARAGTFSIDTADKKTFYLIYDDGIRGFPNLSTIFVLGLEDRPYYEINLSDYPRGETIETATFAYKALPPGTLFHTKGTIFLVTGSGRAGFSSEAVFFSHGYRFDMVFRGSTEDLKLPEQAPLRFRDGTLVNDKGTIYLISQNKKYGFTTWESFTSRGYLLKNAIKGDVSSYEQAENFH